MKLTRTHPAITVSVAIIVAIVVLAYFGQGKCAGAKPSRDARYPAVAGAFYPGGKVSLQRMVDEFLAKATLPTAVGELKVLVVPHAGYVFSGQVAAYGYKALEGRRVDTVIIMSNSHKSRFNGVAVYPNGVWMTPLGEVPVDAKLAGALASTDPSIRLDETAFEGDHTIEVQLPFLQAVLAGRFQIVPVLFGNAGREDYQKLASAILKHIEGRNALVIASTDLSHYPSSDDAKRADAKTIEGILSGDVAMLEKNIAETERLRLPNEVTCACGEDGVKTAMLVAKGEGARDIVLLHAANSGDASGEKDRVVGYAAIGFFRNDKEAKMTDDVKQGALGPEEQKKLLGIARQSVESYVTKRAVPTFEISNSALLAHLGAFVTLTEEGRLRGCIGRFSPTDIPLYQVVSHMAIAAATEDPRFSEVKPDDLKKLRYEISVLSAPEKIKSWKDVELGKHGVIVEKGWHKGVFLPQVATEHNMTIDEFLGELCSQKAGLPRDCYRDPSVSLFTFTAQVFGE
jgi:hypothetical protein